MNMKKAAPSLFLLLLLPASPCRGEGRVIDLRGDPGWLPFRILTLEAMPVRYSWEHGMVATRRYFDLNGDGIDDQVRSMETGINAAVIDSLGRREIWQMNLPIPFTLRTPAASIDGKWDVDGDGEDEIVVSASTPDRMRWLITVLDAASGNEERVLEVSGGEDRRPDGLWDGYHRAFGPLDVPVAGSFRRALVVVSNAALDIEPRCVRAFDLETGEVLWTYSVGPKVDFASVRIIDLEDDGTREIVFAGGGVNNLAGRRINGTTDDHAMVFAIDASGHLVWQKMFGPAPALTDLETADLDGDGDVETVVWTRSVHSGGYSLVVLSAGGDVLAEKETGSFRRGLAVVPSTTGRTVLYTGGKDRVRKYEVSCERISQMAEAKFRGAASVALAHDFLDRPGVELVVGVNAAQNWVLDENLDPLAVLNGERFRFVDGPTSVIRMSRYDHAISTLGHGFFGSGVFAVVANSRPIPWSVVAASTGGAILALVLWRGRTRPRREADVRELRLQLLLRLKRSDHGKIGALSSLRRLIWNIETVMQGFVVDDQTGRLLRNLVTDTLQVGLPSLLAAADLAELAGVEREMVRSARRAADSLRNHLEEFDRGGVEVPGTDAEKHGLREAAATVEERFQALRESVASGFSANLRTIFGRSLTVADTSSVSVRIDLDGAPDCQIDQEELAFVVDNLIDNALCAMRASPRPVLRAAWRPAGDHVVVTLSDTGHGISPDDLEGIMEPGHGGRKGRGLGLPSSREILAKYGGSIAVQESHPGQGTTFVITLPRAQASSPSGIPRRESS